MKPVHAIYTPATREAVEKYNASLAALAAERAAIQAERERVMADAIGGDGTATSLRKRIDSCRDRALQADIAELQTLGELDALGVLARADWKAESEKQTKLEAQRRAVLEEYAEKIGMTPPQIHRLVLEDRARRDLEQARKSANEFAAKPARTPEDSARIEELKGQITAALLR